MQWLPDELRVEPMNGLSGETVDSLLAMGYSCHSNSTWGMLTPF